MAENQQYQDDEIDLRELLASIVSHKKFIIGFTAIVTVLAILYALSITPTYKVSISFLSPNQLSVIELNKFNLEIMSDGETETTYNKMLSSENIENIENIDTTNTHVNTETIYKKFLNNFMSKEFQRKIFDENDYLAKLNSKNEPIDNIDNFFYGFSNSLNLQTNKVRRDIEKLNIEKPVEVIMEGSNAQIIANYLNDLASSADKETIDEFLSFTKLRIGIRIEEISRKIYLLEKLHNKKLNNKIKELSHHLAMAKDLKIKTNNLGNKLNLATSSLRFDSSNELPNWYLLGEKALTKEIELLKSKKYSYDSEIPTLEIEKDRLESIIIGNTDINAAQIFQKAFAPNTPIKPNKRLIVSVAAVAGFVLSILLAFLKELLRTRENKLTK